MILQDFCHSKRCPTHIQYIYHYRNKNSKNCNLNYNGNCNFYYGAFSEEKNKEIIKNTSKNIKNTTVVYKEYYYYYDNKILIRTAYYKDKLTYCEFFKNGEYYRDGFLPAVINEYSKIWYDESHSIIKEVFYDNNIERLSQFYINSNYFKKNTYFLLIL